MISSHHRSKRHLFFTPHKMETELIDSLFPINASVSQGTLPICFLYAGLDALLCNHKGRLLLGDLIQFDGKNKYQVLFPKFPDLPISVNGDELDKNDSDAPIGFQLYVKAYPKLLKALFPSEFVYISDAVYEDGDKFKNFYNGRVALEAITNWKTELITFKNWNYKKKNWILSTKQKKETLARLKTISDNPENYLVNVWTLPERKFDDYYVDSQQKYVAWHCYSVREINFENEILQIVNPHNTGTILTVSFRDFMQYFCGFIVTYPGEKPAETNLLEASDIKITNRLYRLSHRK